MKSRKNSNLGYEIKDILKNALDNKNFEKLNKEIEKVVNSALKEVKSSINQKKEGFNNYKFGNIYNNKEKPLRSRKELIVPTGKIKNTFLVVFGSMGIFAFGIAVFILIIFGFSIGFKPLFITIAGIILPFLILSIILFKKGNSNRKRLERLEKYKSLLSNKDYCLIEDLSSLTGLSNKFIEKDLRKMIQLGIFPEGRINDEKTYFMLTDEIYKEYLKLKKQINTKNFEESTKQMNTEKPRNKEDKRSYNRKPEVRKLIDEGRNFILEIKKARSSILEEEILKKLDRLERVVGTIFDYIKSNPEKVSEIKKFTEYFLPTTLKLVETYKELESQSIKGENIQNSKREIEDTLDTINLAFENLLDDLFQDLAMDISTDISVLEIIFAQEGLTNDGFKNKNKEEK